MAKKVFDQEHSGFYHIEPTYHVRHHPGSEYWLVVQNDGTHAEQIMADFSTREQARDYKHLIESEEAA